MTIIYGAKQVLAGFLTPGDLVLIVSYVKDMWKPVRRIAKTAGDLSKDVASIERIAEILNVEPEIKDAPDAKTAMQEIVDFFQHFSAKKRKAAL